MKLNHLDKQNLPRGEKCCFQMKEKVTDVNPQQKGDLDTSTETVIDINTGNEADNENENLLLPNNETKKKVEFR